MAYTPISSASTPVVPPKKMWDPNAKPAPLDPSQFTGFHPEDVTAAGDLTNAEFFGREQEQKQVIDQIQDYLGRDVDVEQKYGERQQGYLEDIYSQLAGQLGQGVERQEALYGGAASQVGQGYSDAQGEAQKAAQALQASLGNSAERLGQGATLTDPIARLNAEMQALNARLAGSKAGAVGNLQTLGATMVGEGIKGIGTSQREKTQAQTDVGNIVAKNIGSLQLGAQEETKKGLQGLIDIATEKGLKIKSTLHGLKGERTERDRQAYLDKLDEEFKRANLQLQQRSQQFQESSFAQEMKMKQQQLNADAAAARAGDPMAELNYQIKLKEYQDMMNPSAKKPTELSGRQGLDYWITSSHGGDKDFASTVRNFIADVEGSKNKAGMDPYSFAVQTLREGQAGKKLSKPQKEIMASIKAKGYHPDDIIEGLQIYFNQYGKAK